MCALKWSLTPLEGVKKDLAIDLRAIPIMMPFSVPIDTWQIRKRKQTQITVVCTFLLLRYILCLCLQCRASWRNSWVSCIANECRVRFVSKIDQRDTSESKEKGREQIKNFLSFLACHVFQQTSPFVKVHEFLYMDNKVSCLQGQLYFMTSMGPYFLPCWNISNA